MIVYRGPFIHTFHTTVPSLLDHGHCLWMTALASHSSLEVLIPVVVLGLRNVKIKLLIDSHFSAIGIGGSDPPPADV
jgi:hypothetical protein